jgi:dihydrofolate reductase
MKTQGLVCSFQRHAESSHTIVLSRQMYETTKKERYTDRENGITVRSIEMKIHGREPMGEFCRT